MIINIGVSISFLIVLTIIAFVYFSKEKINSMENKCFKKLIPITMIGLLIEAYIYFLVLFVDGPKKFILELSIKFLYMYYVLWMFYFGLYGFIVFFKVKSIKEKKYKNYKFAMRVFYFISFVLSFILPVIISPNDQYLYPKGIGTSAQYIIVSIGMSIIIISSILNIKQLKNKETFPLSACVVFGIVSVIIQYYHNEFLFIVPSHAIAIIIMFFTIENPDLKLIRELELARDHAEKANRAKSDFLSSMSHEIRTPLNAIVGFSEMIETEESIEACKEDAKDIVLASHTLLEIVNGILDISKIEANKMEIVNKEYSLLLELENLAKLMVPRIGDKDLKLISNFAPDIPSVLYGDIGKIKEVITNLLTNAVKYTDSGTINFNVSCINEKEYSSFVISVEDTGRGIKADHIDKLFTKFQRLEEDKNTTIEGTGLGLAITKNLVEMMGGKIVVQSEYGKGSIFTVYLKQKIVKLHDGVSGDAVSSEEKLDFSGKKVLVVDDNGLNIKLAKRLLANYNIDIDTAESGFECIDKVKENKYDLILLDDMMSKMRGTETLAKLKEDSSFKVPVVALTANSLSGMREVYLNAGFVGYLAKPIEKAELNKVLSKYLGSEKDYSDKKILIVDDNKINIKIASKILSTFKFQIDEALSGAECLEKTSNTKYDIIFMDYMMPGMDGIATFNKLKEQDGFDTPVVVLTADVVDNAKEKFMKEGFIDYISKPIDQKYLKEVIDKLIK